MMSGVFMLHDVEIRELVFRLLHQYAPEADLERLGPGENLREELDIDSFDFLQFLITLNEETGIEIPESDYGRVATLEGLLDYVATHGG
jgi:acyl carrier protein